MQKWGEALRRLAAGNAKALRKHESWNFISVAGRSGMKFQVNLNEGPPLAAFEMSRDKVGETLMQADDLLPAVDAVFDSIRCV